MLILLDMIGVLLITLAVAAALFFLVHVFLKAGATTRMASGPE